MVNRLETLPGAPHRVRVAKDESADERTRKLTPDLSDLIPAPVRIEVAGGRSSTASAMRAARVQHSLEEVGASARCVELEGEHATLAAEADRPQLLHVARLPFVRKIEVL